MITGEIRILEVSNDRVRARADGSAVLGSSFIRHVVQAS